MAVERKKVKKEDLHLDHLNVEKVELDPDDKELLKIVQESLTNSKHYLVLTIDQKEDGNNKSSFAMSGNPEFLIQALTDSISTHPHLIHLMRNAMMNLLMKSMMKRTEEE